MCTTSILPKDIITVSSNRYPNDRVLWTHGGNAPTAEAGGFGRWDCGKVPEDPCQLLQRRWTRALGTPEQVQQAWRSLCRLHPRWRWRTTAPICLRGYLWQFLCHPAWWDRVVTVLTAEPPEAALGTRQPHPPGALGFLGAGCIHNTNGITALATAGKPQGISKQKKIKENNNPSLK